MAKLVPTVTVVVTRKGERVEVKPGQTFDFSEAEVNELNTINPEYLRTPVNEVGETTKGSKEKSDAPKDGADDNKAAL